MLADIFGILLIALFVYLVLRFGFQWDAIKELPKIFGE